MEQNACPSHLIDWRVWSDQIHKNKKDQKGTLALGWSPSKRFQTRKGYYHKRSGFGLSGLFQSFWDLHRRLQQTARSSNYSWWQANVLFSWKLSVVQRKYSVTKIDLLAIVQILKEFKEILWSQSIKVFTDHKNLMQGALGLPWTKCTDGGYFWKSMGPRLLLFLTYTTPLQMQPHGLSMTPVYNKNLWDRPNCQYHLLNSCGQLCQLYQD